MENSKIIFFIKSCAAKCQNKKEVWITRLGEQNVSECLPNSEFGF